MDGSVGIMLLGMQDRGLESGMRHLDRELRGLVLDGGGRKEKKDTGGRRREAMDEWRRKGM